MTIVAILPLYLAIVYFFASCFSNILYSVMLAYSWHLCSFLIMYHVLILLHYTDFYINFNKLQALV